MSSGSDGGLETALARLLDHRPPTPVLELVETAPASPLRLGVVG